MKEFISKGNSLSNKQRRKQKQREHQAQKQNKVQKESDWNQSHWI